MNKYNPTKQTIGHSRYGKFKILEQLHGHKLDPFELPLGETQNPLILIVGPPGSNKGRLAREYCRKHPKFSVLASTYTSRMKLAGEVEGENYYFVSEDKLKTMNANGELMTLWRRNGCLYGIG